MKTTKSQAVLYLYAMLQENGKIEKNEMMSTLSLNDLTFKRYISELRSYLVNFDRPEELLYVKRENHYVLVPLNPPF